MEIKLTKRTCFLAFQKGFCAFVGMFLYIFHVKIELFGTGKFDQDPDPDGSALVWLPGSGSAARKKAGSGFG
jgi:hypothetical protein